MRGLYEVFYAGYIFLRLITLAILVYCVLSWFRPRFRAFDMLGAFIRPFVAPFQGLSMKVRQYFQAPVDFSLLDNEERGWLDDYHRKVYAELSPLLDEEERLWLANATKPVG